MVAKPLPGCSRRCRRIRRWRARWPGRCRAGRNAQAANAARMQHDGQGDGVLEDHRGSPLRAARTALRRAVRAAPGFRSTWGARSALIPATRVSGIEARDPCRSVTRSRNRAVLVAFRGSLPLPRPGRARSRRRGRAGGAAAGGDRAFLQHPGAEPGQGGGGGHGQAQQPQDQAAEDGQRGSRVGGERDLQVLVPGEGPGPDDADQGVAGQGVGDRGHRPDGQVPPAGCGGDRVHEHAGGDRGQVQRRGRGARGGRAGPARCRGRRRPGRRRRGSRPRARRSPRRWRVASTIRYWAVKLTAAAAAASTHRPAAALRSHRPEWSWPGSAHPGRAPAALPVSGASGTDGPAGPVSASGMQGVMGWPPGLWPIQMRDVRRMIAVMV